MLNIAKSSFDVNNQSTNEIMMQFIIPILLQIALNFYIFF